jgi:3-oxoacid CoA-transferase
VIAMLEHTDSRGAPKLVENCDFPLTARGVVDAIVTDLALLRRPSWFAPTGKTSGGRFVLEEVAAGFTADEVLSLTGMSVDVADEVRVMQESWI